MNGRGPHAWDHHWLVVPLRDANGDVRGVLWADEPHSRLLPSEHVLQALRIFANHAMEALAVATQLEETRFLADHDPLTRLLNRRALLRELAAEVDEERPLALVFLDLDNFKDVNDGHGHATGDRVLERIALAARRAGAQRRRRVPRRRRRVRAAPARRRGAGGARGRGADRGRGRRRTSDPLVRTLSASFGIAPSAGAEGAGGAAPDRRRGDVRSEALRHTSGGRGVSAEATPTPEQGARAEQPVGLAAGSERLSRLVYLSRAIAAEQVSQRMLRVAGRELTQLLDAEACLISQLEGRAPTRSCRLRPLRTPGRARAAATTSSDYPATAEVLGVAPRQLDLGRRPGRRSGGAVRASRDGDAGGAASCHSWSPVELGA